MLGYGAGDIDTWRGFSWPDLTEFNWATDWFDSIARANHDPAVIWSDRDGAEREITFDGLRENSDRAAGWLVRQGVGYGTRVLIALDGCAALWEIQLAALKLGAVVVPVPADTGGGELLDVMAFSGATVLVVGAELAQEVRPAATWTGISVGGRVAGWSSYEDSYTHAPRHRTHGARSSLAPFLLDHSTSEAGGGVPRGRLYSHYACTVGRLTDLCFTGLGPGERYVTAAPTGSVEHLCFSFLGPLTAGATTLLLNGPDARSVAAVRRRAAREGAQRAYVPAGLLGGPQSSEASAGSAAPPSDVRILSSVSAEELARAGNGSGAELVAPLSAPARDVHWGVRHRNTSIGLMASPARDTVGGELRATALPGHSLRIVASPSQPPVHGGAPAHGAWPARTGEVWIDLSQWPWPDGDTPPPDPHPLAIPEPGTGSLRTGLFGCRRSDGTVALMSALLSA
ncbi:AMP-binding protein [Streptomyces sp. NPDC000878]